MKNKKIKICLANVASKDFMTGCPMNLLYLASYLLDKKIIKKNNIYIQTENKLRTLLESIEETNPTIVGLSVNTPFYIEAIKLIKKIKNINKNIIVVIGGYHISSLPLSLPKECDFGVVGEGEETFAELVQVIKNREEQHIEKLKEIESLVYRDKKNKIKINKIRKPLNIDTLHKLRWNLIGKNSIFTNQAVIVDKKVQIKKVAILYTSRGCPFNCSFCAHRVIWKGVRYFNIIRVCDEMEELYKKYGIDCFQIMDDTFAISKYRLKKIIEELKKRKLLGKLFFYYLFIRADLIDKEFVKLLKEFGTISVFIGVEFGSSRIMKLYKDGNLTTDKAKKACELFAEKDIMVFSSFMLFSPTEKKEEMLKTYALAKWFSEQTNSLGIGFSVTTPYPGTKLWPYYVSQNKTTKENWNNYLMFNANSGSREMSHVFFKEKLTHKQCLSIWEKFSKISNNLNKNLDDRFSLKHWQEKATNKGKSSIMNSIIIKEIIKRIQRFESNPLKYTKKVILSRLKVM